MDMKKKIFFLVIAVLLIGLGLYFVFFRGGFKNPLKWNSESSYVGKWHHYVDWVNDDEVVRQSYAEVNFYEEGSWDYLGYDIEDGKSTNELKYSGEYEISDDNKCIYGYFMQDDKPYYMQIYINNGKLCLAKENCNNYLVKSTSKLSKYLTIPEVKK